MLILTIAVSIVATVVATIYIGKFAYMKRGKEGLQRLLIDSEVKRSEMEADIRVLVTPNNPDFIKVRDVTYKWQGYFGIGEIIEYPEEVEIDELKWFRDNYPIWANYVEYLLGKAEKEYSFTRHELFIACKAFSSGSDLEFNLKLF